MKEEILQTALEQFLKYGIRKITIQKLVEPMGISTKTVYKSFKNKEELLEDVLQLFYNQQYQIFKNIATVNSSVVILFDAWAKGLEMEYGVNKVFFQDLHNYYPELELKAETSISTQYWEQLQQIILRGIDEGVFIPGIVPEIVLESMAVLFTTIVRSNQFKKFNRPPEEILFNTLAPMVRGICTAKGINELNSHISSTHFYNNQNKF